MTKTKRFYGKNGSAIIIATKLHMQLIKTQISITPLQQSQREHKKKSFKNHIT